MSETKTITYFEAFRCAAKHFYGATDLTKYIEEHSFTFDGAYNDRVSN